MPSRTATPTKRTGQTRSARNVSTPSLATMERRMAKLTSQVSALTSKLEGVQEDVVSMIERLDRLRDLDGIDKQLAVLLNFMERHFGMARPAAGAGSGTMGSSVEINRANDAKPVAAKARRDVGMKHRGSRPK